MRPFSIFVSFLAVLAVSVAVSLHAEDRTISTDAQINETVSYGTLKITTSTENGTVNLTLGSSGNLTVGTTLRMGDSSNTQTENLTINGGTLNLTATTGPDSSYPQKYNMVGHYPASTCTISMNENASLVANQLLLGWHGKGNLNINSGTASISNLVFGAYYQLDGHTPSGNATVGANGILKLKTTTVNKRSDGTALDLKMTLSGGTVTTLDSETTATISVPLVLTADTTSKLDVPANKTISISSPTISGSGTLNVTGNGTLQFTGATSLSGKLTRSGAVYLNSGSNLTVKDGGNFSVTTLSLKGGTLTMGENGSATINRIVLCDANQATSSIVQNGGTLNVTGTESGVNTYASFMVGHWPGGATYTLNGGTLNSLGAELHLTWDCSGTFTVKGGTANLLGVNTVDHSNSASNVGTLNLEGGRLNLGASGLKRSDASSTVARVVTNLKSGILGALTDWSSSLNMNLSGTVTVDTAKWDPTAGAVTTTGQTITLSGAITGSGGLTKTGVGTLKLTGANTYTSTTSVDGGTLEVSGSLRGAISIKNGTLNVKEGAGISVSSLTVCDASGNPTCTVNQTGGSVTITGSNFPAKVTNVGSFKISHYPGNANYNLNGGTLTAKNCLMQLSWDGNGAFTVTGGTADLYGIALCDHNYDINSLSGTTAVFRMNYDSSKSTSAPVVKIGAGGINYWRDVYNAQTANYCPEKSANDSKKYAELGNGTIQATANWSSNSPLKLTDAATGTTFNTDQYTITLKNGLTGSGSLKVTGNGELAVKGNVNYTGKTTIESGAALTLSPDSPYTVNGLNGTGTFTAGGSSQVTLPEGTKFDGTVVLKDSVSLVADGTVKNLTILDQAKLCLTASENAADLFTITGDVTTSGGSILVADSTGADVIQIANLTKPGEFAKLASLDAYRNGEHMILSVSGNTLVAGSHNALPEPSTWLLLLLGLIGLKRFGHRFAKS